MSCKIWLKSAVFLLLISPLSAYSQVVISEIMYDLDGSDAKREWIEIFNSGANVTNLDGWKLFEGDSNHNLILSQGSATLLGGGYAVIADDVTTFLIDWPSYSGILFDSSFSLSNTGETLILRDSELTDIYSVSYIKEWGAAGDGNSLTRDDGGDFSGVAPTAGSGNLSASGGEESGGSSESSESSNSTSNSSTVSSAPTFTPKIFSYAGESRVVTVGADTKFKGGAVGIQNKELINARYLWNFGDGTVREGENVLHNFKYPGEYVVVLNVASGQYSASDKIIVKALPANLGIFRGDDGSIILKNDEKREIDLSWWYLKSGGQTFKLPENTYILPSREIVFSSSVTELSEIASLSLLYPNSSLAVNEGRKATENQVTKTIVKEVAAAKPEAKIPAIVPQVNVVQEREELKENDQVAAAIASGGSDGLYKWLLALAGLMGLGIGSALYIQKKGKEEFTIID